MEEKRHISTYHAASEELGERLIKLYDERIFPRQGKVFADMLFQTGIEAGAYIASLADIEDRSAKVNLATNALIKLNQTTYLMNVMCSAGYYEKRTVRDLQAFVQELSKTMHDLLGAAKANGFPVRPASPLSGIAFADGDEDGFNDPV